MHFVLGSLLLGAVAGEGARKVRWRPMLIGAVKAGVRTAEKLGEAARAVRVEAEGIVAEARAELDQASKPAVSSFDI